MYQVSQDYIDIMQAGNSITRRITGTLDNISFTGDDILSGSFSYSGQIVHSTEVKLGGVFIQTVKFSFLRSFAAGINRGSWKGRTLRISIGLLVDEAEGIYEDIPLGEFVIDDAMHSAVGVDVTAYCNMSKLDTARGLAGTMNGTLYEIAELACENCGVTLGQTAEEFADLPNGTGVFGIYEPNDIENWHDVVSWIATTIGGYATFDRQGQLVFRTWTDESTMDISADIRFDDGLYSDFSTFYTGISVVNMKTQKTEYMGMPIDNGLTMNLGQDPFLQYGIEEVRTARKEAILLALQNFNYVPFTVSTYLDPAFDLGDVLTFTGGRAAGAKCCIMSIEYSFSSGLKLSGFGNDPALATARSKVDKDLAGLLGQTDEKKIQYYTYTNAADITGITTEQTIGSFYFATVEETTVTVWHEIQLDCALDDEATPMRVVAHYYLNGVEESYTPIQTIGESGVHTLDYNYFLPKIAGGMRNEWTVTLECVGGSADIEQGDIHICLSGQGLVGEEAFNGIIEVSDTMPLFVLSGIAAGSFTDSASLQVNSVVSKAPADNFTQPEPETIVSQLFQESVTLVLKLDESFAMRLYNGADGNGYYLGDEFDTGLNNTFWEEE